LAGNSMPEALAIVAVFFIAVGVYIFAWLEARNPALHDPQRDLARLHHQATWLQERLRIAKRENWDGEMVANLTTELVATSEQLARAKPASGR
jgi:hypothetical protein